MKSKFLLAAAAFFLIQGAGKAQEVRRCAHDESLAQVIAQHPGMQARVQQLSEARKLRIDALKQQQGALAKTTATEVTIPVVFHIVLTGSQQNLIGGAAGIAQRVDSQIAVMNRDFNRLSLDSASIPAVFKPLFGNARIKFRLARRKPNGTSTPGYEIVTTTKQSFSAMTGTAGSGFLCSDVKYNAAGGADAWDLPAVPGNQYLNIWVLNFTEGSILGIAAPTDYPSLGLIPEGEVGACINYRSFGKRRLSTDSYISGADGGRTAVHEVGHVFGLNHIWGNTAVGSGNCTDDDGISDTPQQKDANSSNCPSFPKPNCTNSAGGEMFMNYMDYVVDGCYKMFTNEQCGVMNADIVSGTATGMTSNPELMEWPTDVADVNTNSQLDVFPNPTPGQMFVRNTAGQTLQQLRLTDLTGRTIRTIRPENRSITEYNLDISDLPRGLYLLECTFAGGTVIKKIVLE